MDCQNEIALISAGSGVFGALLGAIAAVFGPWWLKKKEVAAEIERNYLEARRLAIVDYANKKMDSIQAYHQVFVLGSDNENLNESINAANKSVAELYSLIKSEDAYVKDWINKMSYKVISLKPKNIDEISKADAFLGIGIQHLISWHTGEIKTSDLQPFGLDKNGNSVWLQSWEDKWPSCIE